MTKPLRDSLESVRCCVDVSPHGPSVVLPDGILEMAMSVRDLWKPGQKLRVRFLMGGARLTSRVFEAMSEWSRYANLHFVKVGRAGVAEIRVAFVPGQGSWSYIGSGSLMLPQNQPSMNFGWITADSSDQDLLSVVRHETGHAIGCIHEQASPAAEIPWDRPKVYAYYAGPPNFWDRRMVDQNVFARAAVGSTNFSAYDPTSIMQYPVPEELTLGNFSIGWNVELSATDKAFVAEKYPHEDRLRDVAEQILARRAAMPIV